MSSEEVKLICFYQCKCVGLKIENKTKQNVVILPG